MIRKSIAGILCMVTCITASVDTYAAENIYSFSSVSLQTEGTSQYNAESRGDIESEAKETRNVNELESEESITNTMISVAEESNDTTEQELETHTEIKNENRIKIRHKNRCRNECGARSRVKYRDRNKYQN